MESPKLFFMTSTHPSSLVNVETCILSLIFKITLTTCQVTDYWKMGRLPALLQALLVPQKESSLEIEIFDAFLLSCIPDAYKSAAY